MRSKTAQPRTTDTQWRHKSKKSEILGRCGRQNMLRPYLKMWDWDLILGRAVKAISSLGVRSPWFWEREGNCCFLQLMWSVANSLEHWGPKGWWLMRPNIASSTHHPRTVGTVQTERGKGGKVADYAHPDSTKEGMQLLLRRFLIGHVKEKTH